MFFHVKTQDLQIILIPKFRMIIQRHMIVGFLAVIFYKKIILKKYKSNTFKTKQPQHLSEIYS